MAIGAWMYVVGAGVLFALAHEAAERVIKRRRFRDRKLFTEEEVIAEFAATGLTSQEINIAIGIVSRETTVPRGLLRARDRFDRELAPVKCLSFDDGIYLLDEALTLAFKRRPGEISMVRARDLGNLLEQIGRLGHASK
jgi:hypothetical protein